MLQNLSELCTILCSDDREKKDLLSHEASLGRWKLDSDALLNNRHPLSFSIHKWSTSVGK